MQRTGFRTRGLPGLNAVDAPGTELEPYVESDYPGSDRAAVSKRTRRPGIRRAVQFPAAGRPDAVARMIPPSGLSCWSGCWPSSSRTVVACRCPPRTGSSRIAAPHRRRGAWVPRVVDGLLVKADVRRAPTIEPLQVRLEALELLSPACSVNEPRLHSSQILTHAPVDPDGNDAAAVAAADHAAGGGPREVRAPRVAETLRSRRRDRADGGRRGPVHLDGWQVSDGLLSVSGTPTVGLRHYATFGEIVLGSRANQRRGRSGGRRRRRGRRGVRTAAGRPCAARAGRRGNRTPAAAGPSRWGDVRTGKCAIAGRGHCAVRAAGCWYSTTRCAPEWATRRSKPTAATCATGGWRSCWTVRVAARRCASTDWTRYLTQLTTSRYPGFAEHIASFDGVVRPLPGDAAAVAGLRASTLAEIHAAMSDRCGSRRSGNGFSTAGSPSSSSRFRRRCPDCELQQRRQRDACAGDA